MRKSIFAIGLLVCGLSLAACQKNSQEEKYDIKRPTFDGDFTTYELSEKTIWL